MVINGPEATAGSTFIRLKVMGIRMLIMADKDITIKLTFFILVSTPDIMGVEGLHRDENAHERKSTSQYLVWRNS